MKKKLLLLSFAEGAAVMCAELCGARLLAPLFGSSLYVWASVMGFTLGALAAGYFFGGLFSGRERQATMLRLLLLLAAIYLLLMPALAHRLLPLLSDLSFMTGMLASVAVLLLPPVFFLGATSPFFISLQAGHPGVAGRVSGIVYAVSTAGGIFSTFLCGFWLIPELGLSFTLIVHGAVLLGLTLLFLRGRFKGAALLAGGGLVAISLTGWPGQPVYAKDGIYGRVEVQNITENKRSLRRLLVNGIIQTEIDLSDSSTTMKYVHLLDSLLPLPRQGSRALVLGAGGGSVAKMLDKKGYRCDAVEFDWRVIEAARDWFFVSPAINTVHDDARHFINNCHTGYDLVLVDVFKAEEQPSHVLTIESLAKLRTIMKTGAVLVLNWHGYVEGENARGTGLLLGTLSSSGFRVNMHFTGPDQDYRNALLLATPLSARDEQALSSFDFVNTDDLPRMEKYNARANMTWRKNYLRYYRSVLSGQ
jgi:predicted membrane-bound spermidine synthase